MWTVELTKKPTEDVYRPGFFPRVVMYRTDAEALKREVKRRGGEAVVVQGDPPRAEANDRCIAMSTKLGRITAALEEGKS